MNEGIKHDNNKPRFSLLPKGVMEEVVSVLEHGAKKYAPENWKKVPNAEVRYYDATMRHLQAWWNGESLDPESYRSHLAHAICSLSFLLHLDQNKAQKYAGSRNEAKDDANQIKMFNEEE